MKAMILQYMSELIESNDTEEKTKLKDHLVELINLAKLDLDAVKENHTKKLIIATIKNYAASDDAALRSALIEHAKTLNKLLYNYC